MPSWLSYVLAFGISLLAHVLMAVALFGDWSHAKAEYREPPKSIKVSLVDLAENAKPKKAEEDKAEADRKRRAEQARKRKAEQQRKARQKAERERKAAEQRKKDEAARQAQIKADADAKRQAEKEAALKQAEAERQQAIKDAEQREAQRRADEEAKARQEAAEQSAYEEQEIVGAYTQYITDAIAKQWSRPPSARNTMEVVLELTLVPTGRVVSVKVTNSSGNAAYDQSALTAVRRADFSRLREMDPLVFERNFRILIIKLRPEDLYR